MQRALLCAQEAFRKAALEQLKSRVQGSLKRANASATGDMDELLEQQAELARRDREVSAGVDSVQVGYPAVQPHALRPALALHSTEIVKVILGARVVGGPVVGSEELSFAGIAWCNCLCPGTQAVAGKVMAPGNMLLPLAAMCACRRRGMLWRHVCSRWLASLQPWSGGWQTMRRRQSQVSFEADL